MARSLRRRARPNRSLFNEEKREMRILTAATAWLLALSLVLGLSVSGQGPPAYPPDISGAELVTFKTVDGVGLRAWILTPEGHQASDSRPAIVFFFGGGWVAGNPSHFERQARALQARGVVTILADYRVFSRHQTRAVSAVEDAKSAIRWVRAHAAERGIDPTRIGAAGGSSGGHLAAATATLPGFEAAAEDAAISSAPDALVLFNPSVVIAPVEGVFALPPTLQERLGAPPSDLSPFHHVDGDSPPTLIVHGTADELVPYATAEAYCNRVTHLGGQCQLVAYEGAGHGFFSRNPYYDETLGEMTKFLEGLGWIHGQ